MTDEVTRSAGIEVFDQWTALWNRNLRLAEQVMAPEFVLRYAQEGGEPFDDVTTPAQLAKIIDLFHAERPGLRFTAEGPAVVDGVYGPTGLTGLVARPYLASFGDGAAISGTDVLRVVDGLIAEVWSVSSGRNGRTFYPLS